MALGALVALAFMFAAAGAPVIGDVLRRISLGSGGLSLFFNTLGSITVFAVIYRYAPLSRMGWRAAFIGAVPAGVALQAVPYVIGLYFDAAAGFAAVRLFLLLAVLLARPLRDGDGDPRRVGRRGAVRAAGAAARGGAQAGGDAAARRRAVDEAEPTPGPS